MTNEETQLINGLFERLRSADNTPKDRDAEQLIRQKIAAQPGAPYLMAQTVLVQEQALCNAQARIKELETRLADAAKEHSQSSGGGSFLSGLFGGKGAASNSSPSYPSSTPPPIPQSAPQGGGNWGYSPGPQQPAPLASGGGFLRTALAAAAGVAGGTLLYQGLENMLGNHAPTFGSGLGNGGNFMGGNFMGTGFGGQPTEIIENREVVNNYYDNESRGGGERQGSGGDAISNNADTEDNGLYSTPPHDDFTTPPDDSDNDDDNDPYGTPPHDDPDDASLTDSNDYSSGSDDSGGGADNLV